MTPNRDEVEVWVVPLDVPDGEAGRLYELLADDERERAGRSPWPPRKRRYAARQGRLREVLACYTGTDPRGIELERTALGKPGLAGNGNLHFSVSDSGDLALVAVASRDVGVDVERVEERLLTRRLSSRKRIEDFYGRWTALEARGKAIGGGLFARGDGVACAALDVGPGYAAAVAAEGADWRVRVRQY